MVLDLGEVPFVEQVTINHVHKHRSGVSDVREKCWVVQEMRSFRELTSSNPLPCICRHLWTRLPCCGSVYKPYKRFERIRKSSQLISCAQEIQNRVERIKLNILLTSKQSMLWINV